MHAGNRDLVMKQKVVNYEFVNSQTGNVIAYLSLPEDMDEKHRQAELEKKQAELAISNKMFLELIYWQDPAHPIQ
jgi:hypothetical protein